MHPELPGSTRPGGLEAEDTRALVFGREAAKGGSAQVLRPAGHDPRHERLDAVDPHLEKQLEHGQRWGADTQRIRCDSRADRDADLGAIEGSGLSWHEPETGSTNRQTPNHGEWHAKQHARTLYARVPPGQVSLINAEGIRGPVLDLEFACGRRVRPASLSGSEVQWKSPVVGSMLASWPPARIQQESRWHQGPQARPNTTSAAPPPSLND